jgi:hypothetical protein
MNLIDQLRNIREELLSGISSLPNTTAFHDKIESLKNTAKKLAELENDLQDDFDSSIAGEPEQPGQSLSLEDVMPIISKIGDAATKVIDEIGEKLDQREQDTEEYREQLLGVLSRIAAALEVLQPKGAA